jgi:hypothetical protein
MNPTLWLSNARPYLRARAPWAAIFACLGLVLRFASPSPPPRTAEGVAAMLGAAVGGEVRPDDFVWEARGGALSDAFLGRQVLFLARQPGRKEADLYRARVRLTRAGQPVSLRLVRNLTASPLGDDRELVALGHHAAFVTTAFGAVQGITLLDLDGEGDPDGRASLTSRLATRVERFLATGSMRGVARTEITFGSPPPEARAELQGDVLVMALGKEAQPAALDLRQGTLNTGALNTFAAAVQRIQPSAPAPGDVAVRASGELLGASAGRAVRAALDSIAALRPIRRAKAVMPAGGAPAAPEGADWPPPALTPAIQPARAGEGAWTAGRGPDGKGDAAGAPPCFYETAIRPDPRQPDAVVRLVAIDTRQADLRLEAGVDEPRSQVGLHGGGRPPEGVATARLAAAFAGGPADPDAPRGGGLGFATGRRTFAAPSTGLATVAIAADGRVEMGAWPHGVEVPAAIDSLRQTPDALVGWSGAPRRPLAGATEPADRSGLGLLPSGQLVYAWGAGVSADTLAHALTLAGCTLAVPLATGPMGFAYLRAGATGIEAEPLSVEMALGTPTFAGRAASDLFYVVMRSTAPPAGGGFTADGGRQPSPAWLPAIQSATVVSLGAQVHLTTFAPGRVAFRLRAGAREPQTKAVATLPGALPDAEQPRLVAAVGLGSGRRRGARGLVIGGAVGLPFHGEDAGALVFDHGRPRVMRAKDVTPSAEIDATELPLTADEGKLRAEARDVGSMRTRAAACTLDDGTLALAATTFDSDEAATAALLELGCARVVALDRGSHQAAFVHRAGTETPPQPRYEGTALFAVEVPLSGRSRRIE